MIKVYISECNRQLLKTGNGFYSFLYFPTQYLEHSRYSKNECYVDFFFVCFFFFFVCFCNVDFEPLNT